jgi:hypothetical protein
MRKLLLMSVLCISALPLLAGEQENGFYERARGSSGVLIKTPYGRDVRLGERKTIPIIKAHIGSVDNENTKFYLSITTAIPADLGRRLAYILFVEGNMYEEAGSGLTANEVTSLLFYVMGKGKAEQVSKYFRTSVWYRKHPGHRLQATFVPVKREFAAGEDVATTLRITNVGTNTVSFGQGGHRGARDNQYQFSAQFRGNRVEDIGPKGESSGYVVRRTLRPGEVFEDKVSLKKWFSFEEAGVYNVHGSYYLAFQDPANDSQSTIWEDYVSADFIVTIKERSNK